MPVQAHVQADGRAAGPDRLTDAANVLAIVTKLLVHQLGVVLRDRDEHRVTACLAGLDEATEHRQVLAAAMGVQR